MESNFLRVCNLVTIFVVLCYMTGSNARPIHDDRSNDLGNGEGSADGASLDGALRADFDEGEPGDNAVDEDEEEVVEEFHPVPIPSDFRSYDVLVPDGYISLEELIDVTGAVENVREAFRASDLNNDGRLTEAEFYLAPWMRTGDSQAAAAAAANSVAASGDSNGLPSSIQQKHGMAETQGQQEEKLSDDVIAEIQDGLQNSAIGKT